MIRKDGSRGALRMGNMLQRPWGMVLAGGKSTRLGHDKVVAHIDGRPLLERTLELARPYCRDVVISGRDPGRLDGFAPDIRQTAWLPDAIKGCGPIGGIMTCLEELRGPVLALACDLPMLDAATLDRLLHAWRRRPKGAVMTTFLQPDTGYIESLVSIYEPEALPMLRASLDRGCYKLSKAIPFARRHHIPYTAEEAHVFFNINYPADLAVLMRMSAGSARLAAS